MTNELNATQHPDDAELVCLMDGALTALERRALETHLGDCAACRGRNAVIVRRSTRVSALLREIDQPAPATPLRITLSRRRASATPWRIAAAITLLVAAAAVPPVRAWITGAARTAWTFVAGPRVAVPERAGVAFVPVGPVLTIRVPGASPATIVLETVDSARVTMTEQAGHALPAVTVLPAELQLGAGGDSGAVYVVRVPVRLDSVRLLVSGEPSQVFLPTAVGERRAFTLPGRP